MIGGVTGFAMMVGGMDAVGSGSRFWAGDEDSELEVTELSDEMKGEDVRLVR